MGLEINPEIEILKFSEMMGAMETVGEEKKPEPVELNSFEFFVQALPYFEGEARGQLSSSEQSPATPVESLSPRIDNAIKTAILQESHSNWSKLLDESLSTLNGPSGLLIGERSDDDSLTSMMVNAIELDNNIIGINSSLTNEFQMSDPNLKLLKTIKESNERSQESLKINKKDLKNNKQKKSLKYLPNFKIERTLIS